MFLWTAMDRRVRRLGLLDTKLAQGAAMCVAIILVKLIPEITSLGIGWFVALAVLLGIRPVIKAFGPES
ncbi:MAG: hypothetical protein KAY32_07200 [Candidatus Eisenbacteria sp.]|nr:hypothetical protein [Candidatus Eisenbacteria bacterium]